MWRFLLGFFGGLWAVAVFAATPSNSAANLSTRALYSYLASLPQNSNGKLISGQHMGLTTALTSSNMTVAYGYSHFVTPLAATSGRRVALVGADYGPVDTTVSFPIDYRAVNAPLLQHWQDGGLVTVMYSARNPWTGKLASDRTIMDPLTDLITPGTAANLQWLQQLDSVAAGLQELQAAGVVVLFRPLHEMNGNWFWWGNNAASATHNADLVAVWRHMHDYFSKTKGLDNLLWVYNVSPRAGSAMLDETALYPGDAYVDMVSFDHYSTTFDSRVTAAYAALSTLGKPMALAEFGPTTKQWSGNYDYTQLLTEIRSKTPNLVYFMVWSDYGSAQTGYALLSLASNLNAAQVLNDPTVVTVENLPARARTADVDRLFNWAEQKYPALFTPAAKTQSLQGFAARLYNTGWALGETGGHLYYYNQTQGINDLGLLADWLVQYGL